MALLDSGSSCNLINDKFFATNLVGAKRHPTNVILSYACGDSQSRVTEQATLYFFLEGCEKDPTMKTEFLIVTDLNFDLYLGQPFLKSKQVVCYNSEGVFLSITKRINKKSMEKTYLRSKNILKSKIWYLTKQTYAK